MRVAIVIPNYKQYSVNDIPQTGYHLLLAHEILEYPEIAQIYPEANSYVIVDNSAHEASNGLSVAQLLRAANSVEASELVLPDRLFFGDDTYAQSLEAYHQVRSSGFNLMAVPQGRTFDEWERCLFGLLDLTTTIGISKDYEVWPGGLYELVCTALVAGAKTIHLLGWGRDMTQIVKLREIEEIRGIDSAKPLVYAQAGIALPSARALEAGMSTHYPGRRSIQNNDYDIDRSLIEWNVDVFRRLCLDDTLDRSAMQQLSLSLDTPESSPELAPVDAINSPRWGSSRQD